MQQEQIIKIIALNSARLGQSLGEYELTLFGKDAAKELSANKMTIEQFADALELGVKGDLGFEVKKITSIVIIKICREYILQSAKYKRDHTPKLSPPKIDANAEMKKAINAEFIAWKKNPKNLHKHCTYRITANYFDFVSREKNIQISRETWNEKLILAEDYLKEYHANIALLPAKSKATQLQYIAKTLLLEDFFKTVKK